MSQDFKRSIRIYIDNSDAMKKADDLKATIASLRAELQSLDAQGKKETAGYTKKADALEKQKRKYDEYKAKVEQTEKVLKNLSGATYKELLTVRRQITQSLKEETRGTDIYKAKLEALHTVEKELSVAQKEMQRDIGRQGSMWSRAADGFNKYFGIATSFIAMITGISFTLRKLAEDVAKMDDVFSDVMKTTGMTHDEVLDLNEEFKRMNTRTAREELNHLARDAGKLGITGKKDILDFVEAANQIQVALGEDLGEGAIKNIGKITDVYKQSTKEIQALDLKGGLLAVGSAVNELGAKSSANEGYLVDFAGKMGGIGVQADMTVDQILGLGSALDQNMQTMEMSSTALSKLIMKIMGEPGKFAKIAGMEVGKFSQLIKTDMNGALISVLESLNKKGGLQQLIPIFKDMGLDAARASQVVSSLAANVEKVKEAQAIASQALIEGTSLTKEYDVKNNNLMATLEKGRKAFKDAALELGERLNPALLTSTKWTTYLIKLLPSVLDLFQKSGKYLLLLAGYYLAWNANIIKNNILLRAGIGLQIKELALKAKSAIMLPILIAQEQIRAATIGKTTVASKLAAAAQVLWNNTVKANPWVAGAVALVTLTGAIMFLTKSTREATTQTKLLSDANLEANKSIQSQKLEIESLVRVAKNETLSKEERLKAIKQLNEISPAYLGFLNLENINTQLATNAVKDYTENLRKAATAKAILAKIEKLSAENLEDGSDLDKFSKDPNSWGSMIAKYGFGKNLKDVDAINNNAINERIKLRNKEIETLAQLEHQEVTTTVTSAQRDAAALERAKKNLEELRKAQAKSSSSFNSVKINNPILNSQVEAAEKIVLDLEERVKDVANAKPTTNTTTPTGGDSGKGDKENKELPLQKKELDTRLTNLENSHKAELRELDEFLNTGQMLEADYNENVAKQNLLYYNNRIAEVEQFQKDYKIKNANFLADINKINVEAKTKVTAQTAVLDKVRLENLAKNRDKELQGLDLVKSMSIRMLQDMKLSETEQAAALEQLDLTTNENRNNILKKYGTQLAATEIANGVLKKEAVDASNAAILQSDIDLNNKRTEGDKAIINASIAKIDKRAFAETVTLMDQRAKGLLSEKEYQKQLLKIQEKALDDKLRLNGLTEEQILQLKKEKFDKVISLDNEADKKAEERVKAYIDMGVNFAEQSGNYLTDFMQSTENSSAQFQYNMLMLALDTLRQIVLLATAEAIAKEVGSKGIVGIATGAAAAMAINLAFAAVKGLIKPPSKDGGSSQSVGSGERVVNQRAEGKYDVIGADDGKTYKEVPYIGPATTGIVHKPTLVGEAGSELVVSAPHFLKLRKHINYPLIVQSLQDVQSGRVPQRADGKYNSMDKMPIGTPAFDPKFLSEFAQAVNSFGQVVDKFGNTKFQTEMNFRKFDRDVKKEDNRKKTISKRDRK